MILVVSAFHWAPAAVIAPFQYTQMIWGVLFGYLVWGDVPEPVLFVGGGIVVASGLYILHRETLRRVPQVARSEEHTSELQSLMRISYAVFCLKKKRITENQIFVRVVNRKQNTYITDSN